LLLQMCVQGVRPNPLLRHVQALTIPLLMEPGLSPVTTDAPRLYIQSNQLLIHGFILAIFMSSIKLKFRDDKPY
uniref:Uncharacterized protein n=1 Tax=Aegilops tauschii subsp. strangulata TaxID=200361 RepID=A0A453B5J8_AEGTS